jgi:hypothetical protein
MVFGGFIFYFGEKVGQIIISESIGFTIKKG